MTTNLECDHVKPRGQGGRSDVENGLLLCKEHHEQKTNSQLKIRPEWLDPDQIVYLAEEGWVAWDDEGYPYMRGMKHFEPQRAARKRERVDANGDQG